MVTVSVLTNTICRKKYHSNPITDNMLCAATPGGDACFGDSGGPLTMREKGSSVLEGVISWGKNCAKERWPGVYSRVRKVVNWIRQNTKDARYCERDVPYGGRDYSRRQDRAFKEAPVELEFAHGRGDRRI